MPFKLMKLHRAQTLLEEILNASVHGAGALLSVAALVIMIIESAFAGGELKIIGCCIFGITLILMYLASTLYHSIQEPVWKKRFKVLDHVSIYLLIAGTYTPILLVNFPPKLGWSIFSITWALAIAGVIFKLVATGKYEKTSTVIYLLMGWISMVAIKPMIHALSPDGMYWLLAGGLCYTVGVIFYVWKRLHFSHAAWHIFVLAGSACHFFAILFYVIPMRVT